jgi:hypothetical protein
MVSSIEQSLMVAEDVWPRTAGIAGILAAQWMAHHGTYTSLAEGVECPGLNPKILESFGVFCHRPKDFSVVCLGAVWQHEID